ncbi:MAG: homoserine dehydrogenase [Spirochaetales bacterium]|jgi:homoserine dehydrogenase|nr:homoserine dehydrogenase [Spirochaetales bacterium]
MGIAGSFKVALAGCGTVGGAVAKILVRDRELIKSRSGVDLELKYIIDIRFDHAKELGLDPGLFQTDLETALKDPEIQCVMELIGGTTLAREVIRRCLLAKKPVVTANKALLAHHGAELWALARREGVSLAFEASCGGGIPLIRAFYDGLLANRLDAFYGIVNGTCNFILTEMIQNGASYSQALKQAQEEGLAEADPTLDVSGGDSAHKLTIMAALAFGRKIELEKIPVTGIDALELMDVAFAQELGYVVKLLAVAQRQSGGLSLRVRPAFISKAHPLAWISGAFNAVSIYGHAVGHTMYYGRGAGGSPTASAVVADLIQIALGAYPLLFSQVKVWPDLGEEEVQLGPDQITSRFYIRTVMQDTPGMFAQMSAILSKHGISISSALQKEPPEDIPGGTGVPVVVTTHTTQEGLVRRALEEFDKTPGVRQKSVLIDIIDEHPERI